jgi:hypothetical protein
MSWTILRGPTACRIPHDPLEAHEVDVTLGVARLIAMARAFRVKAEQHEKLSDEVRTAQANLRRAILLAFADGLLEPIAPRAELW